MKKLLVLAVAFVLLASSVVHAWSPFSWAMPSGRKHNFLIDGIGYVYNTLRNYVSPSTPSSQINPPKRKTTTSSGDSWVVDDSCKKAYPDGCDCVKEGDGYRRKKVSFCRRNEITKQCKCFYSGYCDKTTYCDAMCIKSGKQCSGEQTDQCQVNSDCGAGRYCCASPNGNICRDCPCNQNTCNNNGGGWSSGGSGGGSTCDVSKASGVSVSPSYNASSITWAHGVNDHQELYVDTDRAKVLANCANGCLLKKTGLGSGVDAYTVSGLQPGTKYYYRIRSVKACGTAEADGSFSTIPELVVSEADYTNNQKLGKEKPPVGYPTQNRSHSVHCLLGWRFHLVMPNLFKKCNCSAQKRNDVSNHRRHRESAENTEEHFSTRVWL